MNDEIPDNPRNDAELAGPRPLTRSGDDRVLVGVAGGLGGYFGIDPLIFRIGFAISIFFGGLGGLAYLLLAVFVPTDGSPDRVQRFGRRLKEMGVWRGLGIAALALIALIALFALAGGAAMGVGLGWGVQVAIVVIVLGALLVALALRGRGRHARWLILPALALALGAGTAAAADLDLEGGIGERTYRPLSAESIPVEGYALGVGRLVVDLREIDWASERALRLKADLGVGQADILVPEAVCVAGRTHIGVGDSVIAGERSEGVDVDHSAAGGSNAVPRLVLDASVDIGELRVINSDTRNADDSGLDEAALRAAQRRACAAA